MSLALSFNVSTNWAAVIDNGQSRDESRALYELLRERLFIGLDLLLPITLTDDHTLADALRIGQEFIEPNDRYAQGMRSPGR